MATRVPIIIALPQASQRYSRENEQDFRRQVEQALQELGAGFTADDLLALLIDGSREMTGDLTMGGLATQLIFDGGTDGGGQEGIQYRDAGGTLRRILELPGSDVVELMNRAADGTIELHANTSTAGSGGDVHVATVQDKGIEAVGGEFIGASSLIFSHVRDRAANTVRYFPLGSSYTNANLFNVAGGAEIEILVPVKFTNMHFRHRGSPGSGESSRLTLMVDNVASDLNILLSDTTDEGSDTSEVSVAAGSRVCLRSTTSSAAATGHLLTSVEMRRDNP